MDHDRERLANTLLKEKEFIVVRDTTSAVE
jgi:hypothetical protein